MIHIGMEGEKSGSDSEKYYRATQEIMQRQSQKRLPTIKFVFVKTQTESRHRSASAFCFSEEIQTCG